MLNKQTKLHSYTLKPTAKLNIDILTLAGLQLWPWSTRMCSPTQ